MARVRRVFHAEVPGEGSMLELETEEAHHVVQVLRLRPGDALSVFDGRGREWDATLVSSRKDEAEIHVGAEQSGRLDARLHVVLQQGLCRHDRMEWAIQKATEVGVAAIRPVLSTRAEERPPTEDRLERWRRIAREAAKQSGRRIVPLIEAPAPLPAGVPAASLGLLLVPSREARPIAMLLGGRAPAAVSLLVGPEGGLEDEEIERLTQAGWQAVTLGPRTLRTETAGVVAAALVLHAWDDMGSGRELS